MTLFMGIASVSAFDVTDCDVNDSANISELTF